MKTEILNLTYASSLTDLCEINSSFDSGILRIAYTEMAALFQKMFLRDVSKQSTTALLYATTTERQTHSVVTTWNSLEKTMEV